MKTVVKVLDARSQQGRCPRWHQQSGSLFWLDVAGQSLNTWQAEYDHTQTLLLPEPSGCFSFSSSDSPYPDSIILASTSGFFQINTFLSGLNSETNVSRLNRVSGDWPENTLLDGRCDAAGRFWVGSANLYGSRAESWLYSLDATLQLEQKAGPVMAASSIAFSPDSGTIYYADSAEHVIYACEYDLEEGVPVNRRVFHRFPFGKGLPAGAAVDSDGCLWVAMFAGEKIVRLSPGGVMVEEVHLPVKYPTAIVFGGETNTTLFITSCRQACSTEELEQYPESGGIFAIETGIRGMTEYSYLTGVSLSR